jgi:transposase InsO family protein
MDRKSDHASVSWKQAPRYLIRDRDRAYGEVFIRRVRSMSIRDRPTSPRSPWQNAYAERLIGSIRRECLDHVVVFGERHLPHVLLSLNYYNETRTLVGQGSAPIAHGPILATFRCRSALWRSESHRDVDAVTKTSSDYEDLHLVPCID